MLWCAIELCATIDQMCFKLNDQTYGLCNFPYLHPLPSFRCSEQPIRLKGGFKMLGSLKERLAGLGESMTR